MLFRIERHGAVPLEFEGEILASASSEEDGADRWQVLTLYRSATGRYVIERLGESRLPGEVTIRHVWVFGDPVKVWERLHSEDNGRRFLSALAEQVLEDASLKDEKLSAARPQVERI